MTTEQIISDLRIMAMLMQDGQLEFLRELDNPDNTDYVGGYLRGRYEQRQSDIDWLNRKIVEWDRKENAPAERNELV